MFMKTDNFKEVVRALMESRCYFNLNLRERFDLVMHVLKIMNNDLICANR